MDATESAAENDQRAAGRPGAHGRRGAGRAAGGAASEAMPSWPGQGCHAGATYAAHVVVSDVSVGTGGILHHDFAARAVADPGFVAASGPWRARCCVRSG